MILPNLACFLRTNLLNIFLHCFLTSYPLYHHSTSPECGMLSPPFGPYVNVANYYMACALSPYHFLILYCCCSLYHGWFLFSIQDTPQRWLSLERWILEGWTWGPFHGPCILTILAFSSLDFDFIFLSAAILEKLLTPFLGLGLILLLVMRDETKFWTMER